MKALVSGAAGFVGRHFVTELLARGWEVLGVDPAEDVKADWPQHRHLPRDVRMLFDRYDRPAGMHGELARWDTRYDLVVHCAAVEPHRAAIDSKPMLLAANLHLDAAMFEWAVRTKQSRVLYLSSSAAYPVVLQDGPKWGRLIEEDADPFMVRDPDANYGWTKLTGERMAAAANEAGVPTHILRTFSGYGEDQSLNFPFPAIVDRARHGDLSVWGPPGQTRDWIHISDVIAGALAVVDAGDIRPVNLCTGIGTEMGELAATVATAAGFDVTTDDIHYLEDKPTGVLYRVGDPSRMNEHHTAKVSIEEGVRRALREPVRQ